MSKLAIHGGAPVRKSPFPRWPEFGDAEMDALGRVLASGDWGGFPSPNREAEAFARKFAAYHDAQYGICAVNGTVTLEVALRAGGLQAGDEVIVTPFTWIATASAPVYINAVPVFADIDPESYCLDPERIEEAITERTRAVIPVHLGCTFADMDRIMEIARKHDLLVIEDCAHMHGGKWNGKGAGSIGHLGSYSFQSSKLVTAGEGGMILTSDKTLEEKCQALVNCGRKEPGYDSFDGNVFGWNYRIGEFQAAILSSQLDRLADQHRRREENILYLEEKLADVDGLIPVKRDPRITTFACYEYILRYQAEGFQGVHRDRFCGALAAEGIPNDPYFYTPVYRRSLFPLRASEYPSCQARYGATLDPDSVHCPVTERAAAQEAIWFHHRLFLGSKSDMDDIVEAIHRIRNNLDAL